MAEFISKALGLGQLPKVLDGILEEREIMIPLVLYCFIELQL